MKKFYTCQYDRPFKEIFLKETNRDLLIALLESILKVKIDSLTILNSEQNTSNIHIKRKTVDILLHTNIGKIEIELNTEPDEMIKIRNTAYICDLYSHYTLVGEDYDDTMQIIQINFSFGLGKEELPVRTYYFKDEFGDKLVNNLYIIKYNMDYYLNLWYNKSNPKEIEYNKYIIMLGLDNKDLKTLSKEDKVVSKFMKELNELNNDPEFYVYMTEEEDNRKKINTYRSMGIKEGMEQGLEKGMEKGSEQATKNMVKKLLHTDVDIHIIAEASGLSIDEIEALR
jgi:predicted transposase/invertase (TIGR01784 family)